MSVLEYTGLGLLILAMVSVFLLMPKVKVGVRYILWGWTAQLVSAPLQVAALGSPIWLFASHAMPTFFPLLLLMGTYEFVNRHPPRWLWYLGTLVAFVRGLCVYLGDFELGRVSTLPFELAAYAFSAWLLFNGGKPKNWPSGMMCFCMIALCGVEVWDAIYNDPSRSGPVSAFPWLIVLVATGSVQIYAWLDKIRNEVEANARSAKDRFDALTNHARDVIAEIDEQGCFAYVSPNCERVLGIKAEELIGTDVASAAASVKAEHHDKAFAFADNSSLSAIVAEGPYEHLYKIRDPRGGSRFVEIAASHYFNAEGLIRAIAVARDVTERIESTHSALSRQKLESLGTMSAGIAHDFRNLLTAIRGSAELLQIDLEDANADAIEGHFQQIFAASDQASGLTDQLLTYAGKTPVELRPLNIYHTLHDIKPLLVSAIADRARLEIEVEPNLPKILGNPVAVQQMLINLVTNAVEAMSDNNGFIRIHAGLGDSDQPSVQIKVQDSGSGMNAEVQEHIFEPFFTTKFAGRGLGLAALQGLVKAHDGDIKVDSFPGEGATFTINLPVLSEST